MAMTLEEYPVHGWDTWKRTENVGDFARVEPCGEYPGGAMNILPVADTGQKYELTAYGRIPVEPDDCIIVHFTVVASPAANSGATLMFLFEAKDAAGDWLRIFREPVQKTVSLLPGMEQQVTLTADLKRYDAEKIGYLCPEVVVTDLASGVVTILPIRVERKKSDYVPPRKPQGPGLGGYVIQPDALRHFTWPAPVGEEKFERLLNHFAALGLNIVELAPENRSVAWQWPDGDTITAVHARGAWQISVGETPEDLEPVLRIPGKALTAAAYGTGIIFRGADGLNHLVEGGMEATGMTLLHAEGAPDLLVRQIYIADDACSLCWLEEAERELARAKQRYADNYAYLQPMWGAYDCTRYWENAFQTFTEGLAAMRREAEERTEGFGATLVANPVLRDRYNHLVWMASREFIEETGYFGGVFRKTWFTHLGGAGPIAQTFEFARDCDQLVARARRLANANFREGKDAGGAFAAGWANGLEHIYPAAGDNCALTAECQIDAARGEAEDAQLVLTGGTETLDGLTVEVTPASSEAPPITFYRTEYVSITASPMPKLPLCRPGDSRMPDVLIPIKAGEPLRLERDANLPLQLRVRVPQDTKPGRYDYTVSVRAGEAAVELPLRVVVHNFVLPERPLPNIGGLRPSTLREWYGDHAQTARRNLALEMLDCHLEPLDLYSQTPLVEDLDWAVENGVKAWNLGGSLNALADPEPTLPEFLELYGSTDGKSFRLIPAEFALQPRDPNDSLSDMDVVVTPKASVAKYRYLKIHDSEVRGWHNRSNYHFFYIYGNSPDMGPVAELRRPDGTTQEIASARFLQPDQSPAASGFDDFKESKGMALDNLRDASNRGSVLLEKGAGEVASLRLFNRLKQGNSMGISKFYQAFQEKTKGEGTLYLYGFDEVSEHLNGQMVSALKNTRKAFPAICTISTVAHPEATPEIYELLDVHCPANAYATPRADHRRHLKYGIDYWNYIGGGGYYPFGNFERVDQPLVNSRAFLWESIAFDHIQGFLYWDIHMWRSNNQWIGAKQIDWSRWCTTHGHTNGMGALFYPGPDATIYPSRRAHAIGDGIEDCGAYRLAAEHIAAKGYPEALANRLATIREGFATGMSVFNHDSESVQRNRLALYELLDELQ